MELDIQLFILCEKFIEKLQELRETGVISQEEFDEMSKSKVKFMEDHKDKVYLQS